MGHDFGKDGEKVINLLRGVFGANRQAESAERPAQRDADCLEDM